MYRILTVGSAANCTSLQVFVYNGWGCQDLHSSGFVPDFTSCMTTNQTQPFLNSVRGFCSVGGLAVPMDSTLMTAYQGDFGCDYQPVGFQALASDVCLTMYGNSTSESRTCSTASSECRPLCSFFVAAL